MSYVPGQLLVVPRGSTVSFNSSMGHPGEMTALAGDTFLVIHVNAGPGLGNSTVLHMKTQRLFSVYTDHAGLETLA